MKPGDNGASPARDSYTIGLIADTHDVDDPAGVVAALARHSCDYNVHLGDIGGSSLVMHAVRDFKRHLGDVAHLPDGQRRLFLDAVGRGILPLRAYIETVLGEHDPNQRISETGASYRAVLAGMASLSNPVLLRGNVDGMQLRAPHIQACFAESRLQLVTRPRMIDLGWLALILWPSWRPAGDGEQAELAETTAALSAAAAQKSHVIVLAHEHLFKGPPSPVYTRRVAMAGLQQLSVPRFDPNPTWRCVMQFFRRLPEEVSCYYVFGHVHDTAAVMIAGAPALRNRTGPGLRYRLYGLAWRGERPAQIDGTRRSIVMLPVAVNEVALLGVSRDRDQILWQVVQYERAAR